VAPAPAAPAPVVRDSTEARLEKARKATEKVFGAPPAAPITATPEEVARGEVAKKEEAGIQTELETIFDQRLKLQEEFRGIQARAGEGVTRAGREAIVTEAGRKIQEQLDVLNRRELVLETKLGNRQNTIREIMRLQQQDFANASQRYNQQFPQAVQMYNLVGKDDKESNELQRNAKASLKILTDSIQDRLEDPDFNFADISKSTLRELDELDLQAGYETGFTQTLLQNFDQGEKESIRTQSDAGDIYVTSLKRDGTQTIRVARGGAAPKRKVTLQPSLGFFDAKIERSVREDLDELAIAEPDLNARFRRLRGLYSPQEATDEALKNLIGIPETVGPSTEETADDWMQTRVEQIITARKEKPAGRRLIESIIRKRELARIAAKRAVAIK
jgi:hypothetical protein